VFFYPGNLFAFSLEVFLHVVFLSDGDS
jgi:hypothetical protein